jgi:hypothetical protein
MPTFRYSISTGLAGCYMPDGICGPLIGSTRRELASIIRDEIEAQGFPKGSFSQVGMRNLWRQIVRYGSSSMHFTIRRYYTTGD